MFGNDCPTADGAGARDDIHMMDLADGHSSALNLLSLIAGRHAINLGTNNGYSVLEIVRVFENVLDRELSFKVVLRRAGDAPLCCLN